MIIANKTDFKCGYCGIDLPKVFHIDHVNPKFRRGSCDQENLMAACPQCNNFKSVLTLEQFRRELSYQAERSFKYSVNVRMAHKFKQLKFTPNDIVFYFESIGLR